MLLRFRTRNFRSIRDEVELSFAAANISDLPEAVMESPFAERGVLRAVAIYGANASGKSNVLRALEFMRAAVEDSQRSWKPEEIQREPFLFDAVSATAPTLFEVLFVLEGTRYEYGFELDSKQVIREWLHAYPTPRRQTWFEREGTDFTFSKFLEGDNSVVRDITRPNSLFLSAGAQSNQHQLLPIYRWFGSRWKAVIGGRRTLSFYTAGIAEGLQRNRIAELLRAADLGLLRFETEKFENSFSGITEMLVSGLDAGVPSMLQGPIQRVSFVHASVNGASVSLPWPAESEGTLAYFGLLGPVVQTLDAGGILIIDEITASLHPLLARNIVRLFNSPAENPLGGQLIFTTHDTTLLDAELLRRDQVWFTEKDDGGATHLYPLTDFKPRRGENVRTGYLQGRYGGVPFLSFEDADEPPVPK